MLRQFTDILTGVCSKRQEHNERRETVGCLADSRMARRDLWDSGYGEIMWERFLVCFNHCESDLKNIWLLCKLYFHCQMGFVFEE